MFRDHNASVSGLHAAGPSGRPAQAAAGPPGWPPPAAPREVALGPTLSRQLLPADVTFCLITVGLIISILSSSTVTTAEWRCLVTDLLLSALGSVVAITLPWVYTRPAVRLPYITLLRARLVLHMPHGIDMLRILSSAGSNHGSGSGGSGGMKGVLAAAAAHSGVLRGAVLHLRAVLLLFVAVCWLQGCIASNTGAPLPPLLAAPLMGATVAHLCLRAPPGGRVGRAADAGRAVGRGRLLPSQGICRGRSQAPCVRFTVIDYVGEVLGTVGPQHIICPYPVLLARLAALSPPLLSSSAVCQAYVAENSANRRVVEGVYWVLRHVTSLLCLGSREALAAAAARSSTGEQCVAVVWALEVGSSRDHAALSATMAVAHGAAACLLPLSPDHCLCPLHAPKHVRVSLHAQARPFLRNP